MGDHCRNDLPERYDDVPDTAFAGGAGHGEVAFTVTENVVTHSPDRLPFRPRQSLGQNFLRDVNIARKIVRQLQPEPGDLILEIGPGLGALTAHLPHTFPEHRILALDIDQRCIAFLKERMRNVAAVECCHGDILTLDPATVVDAGRMITVVGNLPYQITSPVLLWIFERRRWIRSAVLMMQREVAERLVAPPGTRTRGVLSVYAEFYGRVRKLFNVAPPAFIPRPEVESALVQLTLQSDLVVAGTLEAHFRNVIRTAFQQRRKKLYNALKDLLADCPMQNAALLDRRPETLTADEFMEIARHVNRDT